MLPVRLGQRRRIFFVGISVSVLGAGGVKTDFVSTAQARLEATAEKFQDNAVYKELYEKPLLRGFEATVKPVSTCLGLTRDVRAGGVW